MAESRAARPAVRRLIFGRREKLVVIGALGLIAIGAMHFLIFKPNSDALAVAERDFHNAQSRYQRLQGHNFPENRVQDYERATVAFEDQLLTVIARENLSQRGINAEIDNAEFQRRVRHLCAKWLAYRRNPTVSTNLLFTGVQSDARSVANGQYLWNIPESLPGGVTDSVIRDNLHQARGKYRLIQRMGYDPRNQMDRQRQFNQLVSELFGSSALIYLIGADRITLPEGQWPRFCLPEPLDAFCALAHVNLLLDTMFPPPYDEELMTRAETDLGSLTDEQRQRIEQWRRDRAIQREGNEQVLGLEEMLNVEYSPRLVFYNSALDHVERLVDMAIADEISSIIMIKIFPDVHVSSFPDPWTIPAEPDPATDPQFQARSGALGPRAELGFESPEMMDPELMMYRQMEGERGFAPRAERGFIPQAGQAGPAVEELPELFATLSPIFMQITGDYARVWTFILHLSSGPNLYSVEELSIYTQRPDGAPLRGLAEGHVAADIWIQVPQMVHSINTEDGDRARAHVGSQVPQEDLTAVAVSPEPTVEGG